MLVEDITLVDVPKNIAQDSREEEVNNTNTTCILINAGHPFILECSLLFGTKAIKGANAMHMQPLLKMVCVCFGEGVHMF
jgi:hypothetical protein